MSEIVDTVSRWESTTLESILDFVIGGDWGEDPEKASSGELVEVACIRGSEFKKWNKEKGSSSALRLVRPSSLEKRLLMLGDILLEISGGGPDQPVGRTVLIDQEALGKHNQLPKVCSNFLRLLRVKDVVNPSFVHYYLRYFYITGEVVKYQGGSNNLRNLKYKEYSQIPVPLPPLAEQKRIVAKLDEAFKHLETLKAKLERIPELLKKFRQTVLTHAVTGKLTEEWRKGKELEGARGLLDRFYNYKQQWLLEELKKGNSEAKRIQLKLRPISSKKQHDLPELWEVQSLTDVCLLVVDCHNKTAPYEPAGINLVRTSNVKDGLIVFKDMRYVSEETYKFWSRRCPPASGDIIFTREAPMGEAAIIPEGMNVCLGQRTMLLRTMNDFLHNKFLLYSLLAPTMSDQIAEKAVGTGVKHLRVGDVEGLVVPIPPAREQAEIVRKVEELFTRASFIEDLYISLKDKIDKLPQAILANAFRGKY